MTTDTASALSARLTNGLPLTERRLDIAGVSTVVLEGGSGPPVLILHGQGGFGAMVAPLGAQLVATHRVVIPDIPGLGRSEIRAGELSADLVVRWLDELIAKTCDQPPVLIGMSLGGSIAAAYAADHSDKIDRVVLVASGSLARFRPALAMLPALLRFMRNPTPKSQERFARFTFHDFDRVRAAMGDRFVALQAYQIERMKQPSVRGANRKLLRELGTRKLADDRLASIAVPVSLIWGKQDRVMKFRIAEDASRKFGWPLHPIDRAGHVVMVDHPQAFGEALRKTLS